MTSLPNTLPADLARLLIEQAQDAMIFSDAEGTIQVWNAAATRIFGFSAADALGSSVDIIIRAGLCTMERRRLSSSIQSPNFVAGAARGSGRPSEHAG